MQEIKQILIKKAKIIGQCKYPQKNSRQARLKYLKNIKKIQKQNEYIENQLVQSILALKITKKQDIEKIYFLSFTIMKSFNKKFQFIPQQKDLFNNVIQMYSNFYKKEQSFSKASQVKRIYRNKLCQKEILLSTLLCWLYQWGKKRLNIFLKQNIQSIEKDLLIDRLDSSMSCLKSQKINKNSNLLFDMTLNKISHTQKFRVKSNKSTINQIIQKKQKQKKQKQTLNQKIQTQTQIQIIQTEQQQIYSLNLIRQEKEVKQKEIKHSLTQTNSLTTQNKKINSLINCRQRQKTSSISSTINKQIFYGTCWKQLRSYYKNLNCLQDLDPYYLKTFKKQDTQKKINLILNSINDIVQSIIKTMPLIKKSVQNYTQQFQNNCPEEIKNYYKKINNKQKQNNQNERKKLWENSILKFKQKSPFQNIRFNIKSQNSFYFISKNKNISQINQQSKSLPKKTQIQNYQKITNLNQQNNKAIIKNNYSKKQVKQIKQIKLPVVYNPQNICYENQISSGNYSIHNLSDKKSKNRNKGLIRYKFIQREQNKYLLNNQVRQKTQQSHKKNYINQSQNKQYQVPNIRKILRMRQRQKRLNNGSSFIQSQHNQLQTQQDSNDVNTQNNKKNLKIEEQHKRGGKFLIFLNNINLSHSPFTKQKRRPSKVYHEQESNASRMYSYKPSEH